VASRGKVTRLTLCLVPSPLANSGEHGRCRRFSFLFLASSSRSAALSIRLRCFDRCVSTGAATRSSPAQVDFAFRPAIPPPGLSPITLYASSAQRPVEFSPSTSPSPSARPKEGVQRQRCEHHRDLPRLRDLPSGRVVPIHPIIIPLAGSERSSTHVRRDSPPRHRKRRRVRPLKAGEPNTHRRDVSGFVGNATARECKGRQSIPSPGGSPRPAVRQRFEGQVHGCHPRTI